MRQAQREITGRFSDERILLLDEERETRDCTRRPEPAAALGILRDEAVDGGASKRTVGLIQAAGTMVARQAMPIGPNVAH